jgi:hypothetical protein
MHNPKYGRQQTIYLNHHQSFKFVQHLVHHSFDQKQSYKVLQIDTHANFYVVCLKYLGSKITQKNLNDMSLDEDKNTYL